MQKTCKDSSFWSVWFIRTKQWHIMCFSSWEHFFRWVQGRWICTTDFRTSLQDWKGLLSSLVNGFYPLSRDFVACHFTLQHFYSHPLFLYTYRVKSGEIVKAVNTFALRWHVKDWSTWSSVLLWCSDVLFEAACLWQSHLRWPHSLHLWTGWSEQHRLMEKQKVRSVRDFQDGVGQMRQLDYLIKSQNPSKQHKLYKIK